MDTVTQEIKGLLEKSLSSYKTPIDEIKISIEDSIFNIEIVPHDKKAVVNPDLIEQLHNNLNEINTNIYRIYLTQIKSLSRYELRHKDQAIEINGYLKLLEHNYFLITEPFDNYFQTLPMDMIKLIISNLNRTELVSFLNSLYNDNGLDDIFESLIYSTVNDKELYTMLKVLYLKLKDVNPKFSWKHLYLLVYNLVQNIPGTHDSDIINRYYFHEEYPKTYQELIKYEDMPVLYLDDKQFYLEVPRLGFDWMDYFDFLTENQPDSILILIEQTLKNSLIEDDLLSGKQIDIIKLMKVMESEGLDFSKVNGDYYIETLYELKSITNLTHQNFNTKIIKYLYNITGYTSSLNYIDNPELFKWFRGVSFPDPDKETIMNTRGPIDYDDFDYDELFEQWAYNYEDASVEEKNRLNQTIDFIASDWPRFNKERFYGRVREIQDYVEEEKDYNSSV